MLIFRASKTTKDPLTTHTLTDKQHKMSVNGKDGVFKMKKKTAHHYKIVNFVWLCLWISDTHVLNTLLTNVLKSGVYEMNAQAKKKRK